jgi:ADP-heptose:LPS heptosyltransferase
VRNLVGRLTLRQTASVLAAAGAVVANDSGLGHIAAAVGVPTVMLFGPTPDLALGRFPPNVMILRPDLACAPCWFSARFKACGGRIDCLNRLTPARVAEAVSAMGFARGAALA